MLCATGLSATRLLHSLLSSRFLSGTGLSGALLYSLLRSRGLLTCRLRSGSLLSGASLLTGTRLSRSLLRSYLLRCRLLRGLLLLSFSLLLRLHTGSFLTSQTCLLTSTTSLFSSLRRLPASLFLLATSLLPGLAFLLLLLLTSHTSQLTLLIRGKPQPAAQRALRTENNLQRIMFLQQVTTGSLTSSLLLIQNNLQRRTTLPISIRTTNLTHTLGLNI